MKYFLISGEASGDNHGTLLIAALRRHDTSAEFCGLGGDKMQAVGCEIVVHIRDMAFMGWQAVVAHWRTIRRNFRLTHETLLRYAPDVVILIDYPSFNLRIARWCREHLPSTKVVYYISPKVWAWKRRRIHKIARYCDRVFSILPFEPAFYAQYGYECTYVGNPVVETIVSMNNEQLTMNNGHVVALLPGSREGEITHCLPTMLVAARKMLRPDERIVVVQAPAIDRGLYERYLGADETLVTDAYSTVKNAYLCVVNSGTATLETALLGTPQVAVYHIEYAWLTRLLRPLVMKTPLFTLPNLLLGRVVVRELVADEFREDLLCDEIDRLHDEAYRGRMIGAYKELWDVLGTDSPSEKVAEALVGECLKDTQ